MAGLIALAGCAKAPKDAPSPVVAVRYTEVSRQIGIKFTHENGAAGKKYMPETVGSGVGFIDFDNDGWQDLLFVNSTGWPGDPPRAGRTTLYRNLGTGRFEDVTSQSGLGIRTYGMGVAAADYDNDGFTDLYVTAIGSNRLFRNTLGDPNRRPENPIFQDVTESAGLQGVPAPGLLLEWKWSVGAAWLDYDRDGNLDLFVLNYVKWSPDTDVWCGKPEGPKAYCPPGSYEGYPSTLYRNLGGGRFRDVSVETGIRGGKLVGKSFGIACADYNGDGWTDVAVANDTWPNFLFVNQGGRSFAERGVEAGIAYGDDGQAKAGMGIDSADWKNDGKVGLLIGNFSGESLSLFDNSGDGFFTDVSHSAGVAHISLHFLTFGLFFFDYDLDGWQDIFTANGHIDEFVRTYNSMVSYKERPMLFHNDRNGTFSEVGVASGLTEEVVGRGAAWADYDHDGDPDIALVSNGRPARFYRNDALRPGGWNWVRIRLEGTRSNRDGIGAKVSVVTNDGTQNRFRKSGGSFLSESDPILHFGLGNSKTVRRMEIVWPGGKSQISTDIEANRQYLAREDGAISIDTRYQSGDTR